MIRIRHFSPKTSVFGDFCSLGNGAAPESQGFPGAANAYGVSYFCAAVARRPCTLQGMPVVGGELFERSGQARRGGVEDLRGHAVAHAVGGAQQNICRHAAGEERRERAAVLLEPVGDFGKDLLYQDLVIDIGKFHFELYHCFSSCGIFPGYYTTCFAVRKSPRS